MGLTLIHQEQTEPGQGSSQFGLHRPQLEVIIRGSGDLDPQIAGELLHMGRESLCAFHQLPGRALDTKSIRNHKRLWELQKEPSSWLRAGQAGGGQAPWSLSYIFLCTPLSPAQRPSGRNGPGSGHSACFSRPPYWCVSQKDIQNPPSTSAPSII